MTAADASCIPDVLADLIEAVDRRHPHLSEQLREQIGGRPLDHGDYVVALDRATRFLNAGGARDVVNAIVNRGSCPPAMLTAVRLSNTGR